MTDSTDEPPNGPAAAGDDAAPPVVSNVRPLRPPMGPARRRWLAGGIVLVVGLVGGAVLGGCAGEQEVRQDVGAHLIGRTRVRLTRDRVGADSGAGRWIVRSNVARHSERNRGR